MRHIQRMNEVPATGKSLEDLVFFSLFSPRQGGLPLASPTYKPRVVTSWRPIGWSTWLSEIADADNGVLSQNLSPQTLVPVAKPTSERDSSIERYGRISRN